MATKPKILKKTPAENEIFTVDFASRLDPGESITGVAGVTTVTAGLTIGTPTFSATQAQFRLEAGTIDTEYVLKVSVNTDQSAQVKEEIVCLLVEEKC